MNATTCWINLRHSIDHWDFSCQMGPLDCILKKVYISVTGGDSLGTIIQKATKEARRSDTIGNLEELINMQCT